MAEILLHDWSVQESLDAEFERCHHEGQIVIIVVDQKDGREITLVAFGQVMQDLQASHAGHLEAGDKDRWKRILQAGSCNEPENILTV